MEAKVSKFLLKEILPKLLYSYITKDYYPVIVGGADVDRCAKVDFRPVTDIDMKFIATNISTVNEYEIAFVRDECIGKILSMYDEKKPKDFPNLVAGKVSKVYSFRVPVHIEGDKKAVIIDTSVIGQQKEFMLQYKYINYSRWIKTKNESLLVPFEMVNNLPWADCAWVYIDTVRMLMVSLRDYTHTDVKSQKLYLITKVIKYIGKLAHLEVYYRKHVDLKPLLIKAKKALVDFGEDGDKLMASLMVVIKKDTDFTKVSKILRDAESVKDDIEYFRKSITVLVHTVKPNQKNAIIQKWFKSNERFVKGGYIMVCTKDNVIINKMFSFRK
jgi:hypothetical protein